MADGDRAAWLASGRATGSGGYFGGRGAFLTQARDRGRVVKGDVDGDGKVSLAERYDKDGDGKISMHEYAAQTNSPNSRTHGEQHAAANVGVSAAVREGWASFRADKFNGRVVPAIAERMRTNTETGGGGAGGLVYDASRGGWTDGSCVRGPAGSTSTWAGPGRYDGNRNVKAGDRVAADAAARARNEQLAQADPVWARKKLGYY